MQPALPMGSEPLALTCATARQGLCSDPAVLLVCVSACMAAIQACLMGILALRKLSNHAAIILHIQQMRVSGTHAAPHPGRAVWELASKPSDAIDK